MKRILSAIILLAPLLIATAQQEYQRPTKNIFIYSGMRFMQTSDSTAEVYFNAFENLPVQDPLIIPETVQDSASNVYTVTRVGNSAFADKRISEITFPESIREIGDRAFAGNDSLRSISFPSGLRRIENYSFSSCNLAGMITLPDSLEYLAANAFYLNTTTTGSRITRITEYDITGGERFCTVNGILYNGDTTELVLAPNVGTDTFYLPANVRRLGEISLTECGASHIVLNDSLREIGLHALPGAVQHTTIPASVTHIDGCFRSGTYVLPMLTIMVDSANRSYRAEDKMLLSYDGDTLVMGYGRWTNTKSLPEGIRVIAKSALGNVGNFDTLELPNSLEEICDQAFSGSIFHIAGFPNNLRKIGTRIMPYHTMGKLRFPNSLTDIADYALEETFIDTVILGDSLRVIPRGLFNLNQIKKLTLGRNVEQIMPEAFSRNAHAMGITLKINDDYMPEGLRTIGRDAFLYCIIERARFRHNPDTIGDYAFNRLKRVFFVDTIPPIAYDSSFMVGCTVYVPCHGADPFLAAPGWGPNYVYMESPCPPTAIDDLREAAPVSVAVIGETITIERTEAVPVDIIDMLGRNMLHAHPGTGRIIFTPPASGIYIVRSGTTNTKVAFAK